MFFSVLPLRTASTGIKVSAGGAYIINDCRLLAQSRLFFTFVRDRNVTGRYSLRDNDRISPSRHLKSINAYAPTPKH